MLKTVPEKATFLQSLHPRDRLRLLGMVEFLCCCIQVSQELLHSHVQQLFGVTCNRQWHNVHLDSCSTSLNGHTRHTCLSAPRVDCDLSNSYAEHPERACQKRLQVA